MSSYLTFLGDWRKTAATAGTGAVLAIVLTFILDYKKMLGSETAVALEIARSDLREERAVNHDLNTRLVRVQEAYETLASAYWDEPIIGWIKGRNGRYIQANKKFIDDLVIAKRLDPQRIIGYTDYEIWGDTALARTYDAHDQLVIRNGHMMEFHEQIEIAGHMQNFISRKYPVYSTRGDVLAVGGAAFEDCE